MSQSVFNDLASVATFFLSCVRSIGSLYTNTILIFVVALFFLAWIVRIVRRLY